MSNEQDTLKAWLLPITENTRVALGQAEVKYIEQVENPVRVPGLPAYSELGFEWRGLFVPIINLPQLITRRRKPLSKEQLVAIVAYQPEDSEDIRLGALALTAVPKLETIEADTARPPAELPSPWPALAHAAFDYRKEPCPVLDLSKLFSTTPSRLLTVH